MSGIAGIVQLDGGPLDHVWLRSMTDVLSVRGPDRQGVWYMEGVGLCHTLLATTPESLVEGQPLVDRASNCVITADVRLDNREDLMGALGLSDRSSTIGDAELILISYQAWGEECVNRLLGDFAFAIWDKKKHALFCARDHFGMRPIYYHHSPGSFFAFASEPRAILILPKTPYRINEGRIADYLIPQLESIDETSTFFDEVYRLPPARTLTVTRDSLRHRDYWRLEAGPVLHLRSDDEYAEAFVDVFSKAVRCRLRSAGKIGSMLSGGVDSGSVTSMASQLLSEEGRGPLPTFSATSPELSTCIETRSIILAQRMEGLDPYTISYDRLDELMPALQVLIWSQDEPFDINMTLLRSIYLSAHDKGIKVLLDGSDGDIVLAEGTYLARLLRRGRWLKVCREVVGQRRFYGRVYPTGRVFCNILRSAFVPNFLRHLRRSVFGWRREQRWLKRNICSAVINPAFARRISLRDRFHAMERHSIIGLLPHLGQERACAIDHPNLTVGCERYVRVASAVATEPRDPFLDLRVVAFCLSLPSEQKLCDGWPKTVLRRAMRGRLPEAVIWRRGKEHLGWSFTMAFMELVKDRVKAAIEENWDILVPYVNRDKVVSACQKYFENNSLADADKVYQTALLAVWLRRHAERPTAGKRSDIFLVE